MKCKSCQGDVPPKFSHAILVNQCPLCGEVIMDDELQAALKDLKSAMTAVATYPSEIFDWLKSNYSLHTEADIEVRVKEAEEKVQESSRKKMESIKATLPTHGLVAEESATEVQLDKNGNQISGPSLQSSAQTNKFFKNAQANKAVNQQQHFKNIVKQIKTSGSPALMDESGTAGVITPGMAASMGEVDPQELAELRAAFGDDSGPQSSLDGEYNDYEDEIPSVVMNMANQAGGGQGMNQRDLAKLQNLQGKSARAKHAMASGGSIGLIKR